MKRKILLPGILLIFSLGNFFAQSPASSSGSGHSAHLTPTSLNTKNTRPFNGFRLASKHEPFHVDYIESTSDTILVTFNIPVNPATCRHENIFINRKMLDKSAEFRYNKTGKILEIRTRLSVGTKFTLEFQNLKSYDQEELKVKKFESLLPWTSKDFTVIKANQEGE